MLTRLISQHLDDAALAEIWTNAAADGKAPSHPHFEACAECRLRFTSFTAWLDEVRDVATSEAELAFPAEKLAVQQQQILRRLEAADEPTRVIAFPKVSTVAMRPSPVRRWVTAAAAAGLMAGIGLGQVFDLRHLSNGSSTFPEDRQVSMPASNPGIVPAVVTFADDVGLAELEAMATPRYEALRPYDSFTPRVADLIAASR